MKLSRKLAKMVGNTHPPAQLAEFKRMEGLGFEVYFRPTMESLNTDREGDMEDRLDEVRDEIGGWQQAAAQHLHDVEAGIPDNRGFSVTLDVPPTASSCATCRGDALCPDHQSYSKEPCLSRHPLNGHIYCLRDKGHSSEHAHWITIDNKWQNDT